MQKVSIILAVIVIDSLVGAELIISVAPSTWYDRKLRILAAGKNVFIL